MGEEGIDKLSDVNDGDVFSSRSKSEEAARGGRVIIAGDVIERVKMVGSVVNKPPAPLSLAAAKLAKDASLPIVLVLIVDLGIIIISLRVWESVSYER